jgi:hypothetical protein
MSMAPLRLLLARNGVLIQKQPVPCRLVVHGMTDCAVMMWRTTPSKPISSERGELDFWGEIVYT